MTDNNDHDVRTTTMALTNDQQTVTEMLDTLTFPLPAGARERTSEILPLARRIVAADRLADRRERRRLAAASVKTWG
jgi:hypothetical protein